MSTQLITAPTALSVELADAKLQLRETGTDQDSLITRLIHSAAARAEHETGRCLMPQTWELVIDAFPTAEIELPKWPCTGITSVKYLDVNGTEQTLASNLYTLDDAGAPHWLFPAVDTTWPATQDVANAVRVRFTASTAASAAALLALVPGLVDWLFVQVATLYDHRDAVDLAKADADACGYSMRLLDPYRTYR